MRLHRELWDHRPPICFADISCTTWPLKMVIVTLAPPISCGVPTSANSTGLNLADPIRQTRLFDQAKNPEANDAIGQDRSKAKSFDLAVFNI